MTAEEYTAVQGYILGGAQFFEPEINPAALQPKDLCKQARLAGINYRKEQQSAGGSDEP